MSRAEEVLRWQVANGVLHVRSHVDVTDPAWLRHALAEVRDCVRGAFEDTREDGVRSLEIAIGIAQVALVGAPPEDRRRLLVLSNRVSGIDR